MHFGCLLYLHSVLKHNKLRDLSEAVRSPLTLKVLPGLSLFVLFYYQKVTFYQRIH